MRLENPIILGKVSGVFGVKGWIKVYSETAEREGILSYQEWYLSEKNGDWTARKVEQGKKQGKNVIAKLAGCDDRDAAEELRDKVIAVERSQLPSLAKDEFYWSDLQG